MYHDVFISDWTREDYIMRWRGNVDTQKTLAMMTLVFRYKPRISDAEIGWLLSAHCEVSALCGFFLPKLKPFAHSIDNESQPRKLSTPDRADNSHYNRRHDIDATDRNMGIRCAPSINGIGRCSRNIRLSDDD